VIRSSVSLFGLVFVENNFENKKVSSMDYATLYHTTGKILRELRELRLLVNPKKIELESKYVK